MSMGQHVLALSAKSALQEKQTGAKGANLARLRRSGFQVPPGFIITSSAFHQFLKHCGVEGRVLGKRWSEDCLEQSRRLLMDQPIPPSLSRPIAKAYQKLGGRVAVRSSMVGEDAVLASFAGQLETTLNVQGVPALLEAVQVCWASVFSWRLIKYMNDHKPLSAEQPEELAMAVVVQRMIEPKAAGVAFSADPITGQRCVVIEAVHGLGQALVQGQVKPDRYVVDSRGVLSLIDPVDSGAPVLDREQILQLTEVIHDVACRAQNPQDVEWAWDGTNLHILQSRPITSLVGKRVYSNKMVSDMSPGLVKPLVYSTKTTGMANNVFGRMFTELIGPNDVDFSSLVTRVHSRLYTDVTLLGELFEKVGMPANFFQMISRDERTDFRRPRLTLGTLRAMARVLRFALRHSSPADEINTFLWQHERNLERYRQTDWSDREPHELLGQFDHLMQTHGETQWFVVIGPTNMAVRNRMLGRFINRRAKDVVASDLIRGLVGLKALEPNADLQAMAQEARALDVADRSLLVEGDNQTIRATLSTTKQGRALIRSVDAFLSQYGFLSINGTDFTVTPWCENPDLIWNSIGRLAASAGQARVEDVQAIREDARRRARSQLGWIQRRFFDRLLASTITYIDLRERTSFLMSQEAYEMRRIFVALGEHLVAHGSLAERDDIFYLTYDELRQVVEGTLETEVAQRLVSEQKAVMAADAQIEPPDTICGEYVPAHPMAPADDPEYLVGISGSSGLAKGRACVVLDPAAAPTSLGKDDILVVPFTDVGWTPLFSGIGGIVAETGGQLSHTSIVAREYGLPAVVNVRQATRLILDGQTITVDGNQGRVYLKPALD
jgi:phosphohistidine swiveling domain-containing protein